MKPLRMIGTFFWKYVVPDVRSKGFWVAIVLSLLYVWFVPHTVDLAIKLLLIVLVHEIGHTLGFLFYGYPANRIFVSLIGGLAGSNQIIWNRKHDFVISILGPVFGFGFALLTFIGYVITGNKHLLDITELGVFINLFNLLPVFPLDGGRIVRCICFSLHLRFGLSLGYILFGITSAVAILLIAVFQAYLLIAIVLLGILALTQLRNKESYFIPMPPRASLVATVTYLGVAGLLFSIGYGTQNYVPRHFTPIPVNEQSVSNSDHRTTSQERRKLRKKKQRQRERIREASRIERALGKQAFPKIPADS